MPCKPSKGHYELFDQACDAPQMRELSTTELLCTEHIQSMFGQKYENDVDWKAVGARLWQRSVIATAASVIIFTFLYLSKK